MSGESDKIPNFEVQIVLRIRFSAVMILGLIIFYEDVMLLGINYSYSRC